jgi:transposase InsO family protein
MSSPQLTPAQRAWQRRRLMKEMDAGTRSVTALAQAYGYARKTLYKWHRRWCAGGRTLDAVRDRSRAPHSCPRRIPAAVQAHLATLARQHPEDGLVRLTRRAHHAGLSLSVHGVYVALKRAGIYQPRPRRRGTRRYQKVVHTVPGELVQADLLQLSPTQYQLTVIDSASRYLAATLLPNKEGLTVKRALTRLLRGLPFPVQTLQTDHGTEFTYAFMPHVTKTHPLDVWCADQEIAHRLIPIAYPQANGKVERVHRICRTEFYRRYRLRPGQTWTAWLPHYVEYYNTRREHGSLHWRTPADELARLQAALRATDPSVTHV